MKQLEAIHIVQFSFFEADSFETRGNLTLLGPNGVGKTSVLDAIQIAMLGAHGTYVAYNSQSVSSKQRRTLRDYCLGVMRPTDDVSDNSNLSQQGANVGLVRKRDHALSYITLVFGDASTGETISAGICLSATISESDHRLLGLYVSPGIALTLEDHLQAVDEGTVPLDWGSFEVELQRRAKTIGRTPHISTHPEAYIEELLHAIQPTARHIDRHAFVRAFKKSMQLKDIENVNDFVRDYLVDAQPINKQAALTQIVRFKQLKALIDETEEQIEQLDQIYKYHNGLLNAHRRRDTILAIKTKLKVEQEQKNLKQVTNLLSDINRQLAEIQPQAEMLGEEKKRLTLEIEDIIQQIARDPASLDLENNNKMRSVLQSRLNDNKSRLNTWNLDVRQTLQAILYAFSNTKSEVTSVIESLLNQFEFLLKEGEFIDLTTLKQTRERLTSLQNQIAAQLETAKQTEISTEVDLKSLLGQTKAITQGAGRLSQSTGVAIRIFHEHGIEAQPISALIEIKDSSWQAAIEAFLGRHRESLVVERGKERSAVQLLRRYGEQADWLFNVTIVQPAHLNIAKYRAPEKETVSALISGSNEIAVTYVRQLLGDMLSVQTEEELERNSRALTADGMISANGGTRRLRLPSVEDWRIGSKLSASQKDELFKNVTDAQKRHEQARREHILTEQARDAVRSTLKNVELTSYNEALTAYRHTQEEIDRLPDPATIKEPSRLVALREKKKHADNSLSELESWLTELRSKESSMKASVQTYERDLQNAQENLALLEREHEQATQAQDFDVEMEPTLYQEIAIVQDEPMMIAACDEINNKAAARIQSLHNSALPAFTKFIDYYNVSLIDERSDWRMAMKWTEARLSKLRDSDLVSYKAESEEALKAAEETFRQDIAYRLREAIQRLEQGIRQLNGILKACPAFSGNEHYQFSAKPAKAHEKIYKFISNVDKLEGMTGSLLASADDARQEIINLLETSALADSKKLDNPLEDYRLLYNFDLEIYQGQERVGLLSQRIGVASNGEHRVPFYVIAGAALAAAYRIQSGKKNDGAALMLLDEAFYGMDSQNSYATAQFLRNIGMQLIMAGPEADQGKLAPMTDSLYELTRYGADVFYEKTHFTEKLHQLMTSDMPMLYPDLIDEVEQAMTEKEI